MSNSTSVEGKDEWLQQYHFQIITNRCDERNAKISMCFNWIDKIYLDKFLILEVNIFNIVKIYFMIKKVSCTDEKLRFCFYKKSRGALGKFFFRIDTIGLHYFFIESKVYDSISSR